MAHSTATAVTGKSVWDGGTSPMGASYGKLMMWFFLLSDAFTFSGLLITYGLVRSSHTIFPGAVKDFTFSTEYWPVPEKVFEAVPFLHGYELPLVFVGIMTFILIMSSVTMVLAVEAGHRMDRKAVEKWMLWTIIGGATFLACQAWEWTHFIVGTDSPTIVKDFVKRTMDNERSLRGKS
jgi:cytochrome c oxidase subunit 3